MSDLEPLLRSTSRTFALSIPLLPQSCRDAMTVAYLVFRIADTLEDEAAWPAARRIAALRELEQLLRDEQHGSSREQVVLLLSAVPVAHTGYAALMASAGDVLERLEQIEIATGAAIRRHLCRTIAGMCEFLARDQGPTSVADLRAYCYAVAGIVGELCTELFVASTPTLQPAYAQLMRLAVAFGEGLQLVNILKDEHGDALQGRRHVPLHCDRPALFTLAENDLRKAGQYVELLESYGSDRGIVAFNTLNLQLAHQALARIRSHGSGAKLTRDEVLGVYAEVKSARACRRA